MDIIIVIIIIVASVCLLFLWLTLTCCWRRRHTDWLRRESTRQSSEVVAKRLQGLNDKVEIQLNQALEHSFPRPCYDASKAKNENRTAATDAVQTAERAMQTLITACIQSTLEAKAAKQQGSHNTMLLSTLELLANIDACVPLLHMVKIAVNNAYAAIGQIVQIEGCTVFDDVVVVRDTSDNSATLEQLQKRELEKATPSASCCCLPFCCTTRSRDKERFRKNRSLFFMAAGTRFCSAVNIMEPEEEAADRMAAERNNKNVNIVGEEYNTGYGGGRRRRGRKDDLYGDDEDDAHEKPKAGKRNHASVYAPPVAPAGIPTAIDVPPLLAAFEEGGPDAHKMLHMADAISRRMIKVSGYASKLSKVSVTKIQSGSGPAALEIPSTHTSTVAIASHPDLLSTEDTAKLISCLTHRRHVVDESLLVPAGGWVTRVEASPTGSPTPKPSARQLEVVGDLKPLVLKDLAGAFPKGLPLVSKAMDKDLFACGGVRDDLIVFFANLRKVAQRLGSVRNYASGGGEGLVVNPDVRNNFAMYNAIELFDYQAKKWLIQVAMFVACEAARAYHHGAVAFTKGLSTKAIQESMDRVTTRAASGLSLPPQTNETPKGSPTAVDNSQSIDLFSQPLSESKEGRRASVSQIPEQTDASISSSTDVIPKIRVRSLKVDRIEQRIHNKVALAIEAAHDAFAMLGLAKKGAIGGIIVSVEEILQYMRAAEAAASPQLADLEGRDFSKFLRTYAAALAINQSATEHLSSATFNLRATEQRLRASIVSPTLLIDVAADDACKHQARRGLLSLRETLVDVLCPPLPPNAGAQSHDAPQPVAVPSNGNSTSSPLSPVGRPPTAPRSKASAKKPNVNLFSRSTTDSAFSPREEDEEELQIMDEVVGDAPNGGQAASASPHPSALLSIKEAYCVYHQITIAAVRRVLHPMERMVTATVTDAEAQVSKALLLNFAPKGKQMVSDWERLIDQAAFPVIRRVAIKLYLYQHCAALGIILNSAMHHLKDSSHVSGRDEQDRRLLLAECCEGLEKSLLQVKQLLEIELPSDSTPADAAPPADEIETEESKQAVLRPSAVDMPLLDICLADVSDELLSLPKGIVPEAQKLCTSIINEVQPLLTPNRFLALDEVASILHSGWSTLGIDVVPIITFK